MTIEEMIEVARRIKICASKPFDEVCFSNHCGECPAHYSQKEQEQIVDALPELLRELQELRKNNRKAIEALEKQIPMTISMSEYRNDYDWTCNKCNETFYYVRYSANKPNYCPKCGQAIKWN